MNLYFKSSYNNIVVTFSWNTWLSIPIHLHMCGASPLPSMLSQTDLGVGNHYYQHWGEAELKGVPTNATSIGCLIEVWLYDHSPVHIVPCPHISTRQTIIKWLPHMISTVQIPLHLKSVQVPSHFWHMIASRPLGSPLTPPELSWSWGSWTKWLASASRTPC